MGSWNATCGLSGLPITRGTRAKLVLLTQGLKQHEGGPPPADGTTYPDDLWRPVVWPITGLYDDYGLIEKLEIPSLKLFGARLERITPKTEDAAFFKALAKKKLDRDTEAGRRFYGGDLLHKTLDERPLGHVLIREDVWEAALNISVDVWHTESSRADNRREMEAYLDEATTWVTKNMKLRDQPGTAALKAAFDRSFKMEHHEKHFIRTLFREGRWFENLVQDAFLDKMDLRREDILPAAYEVADLLHLRNVMMQLRMSWSPGTSRGSQETSWETHKVFHQAVIEIAEAELKKDEEEL